MMPRGIEIKPPIVVTAKGGNLFTLSTVEQVIDFVRRNEMGRQWSALRDFAFVVAAVPSPENIDTLRKLAAEAFEELQ
jgi:hypothetical protein